MQSDPLIWQIIKNQFCSFKVVMKEPPEKMCRNEYNVSGLCRKTSCPLANSRYATVREENGLIFLYVKTIERAHTPRDLWEKIELSPIYTKALAQIDDQLEHWPAKQVHKVKQRLTKLHQYLLRMRRLIKRPEKIVRFDAREQKRDNVREAKALEAARLDFAIKKELLERLKNKTYGDLYNLDPKIFNKVMDEEGENEVEFVADDELDKEMEEDMEDIENADGNINFEEEFGDMDDMDLRVINNDDDNDDNNDKDDDVMTGDIKDLQRQLLQKIQNAKRKGKEPATKPTKKPKSAARVEIEYEEETEPSRTHTSSNW